jgi:hypothetical protein
VQKHFDIVWQIRCIFLMRAQLTMKQLHATIIHRPLRVHLKTPYPAGGARSSTSWALSKLAIPCTTAYCVARISLW